MAVADPMRKGLSSQATFSEKLSLSQYAQGCFLANLGYDSESNLAFLDVKDRASRIPLGEDYLFLGKGHDFPTLANCGKEFLWVEIAAFLCGHDGLTWYLSQTDFPVGL
jgi:hypothetical protein